GGGPAESPLAQPAVDLEKRADFGLNHTVRSNIEIAARTEERHARLMDRIPQRTGGIHIKRNAGHGLRPDVVQIPAEQRKLQLLVMWIDEQLIGIDRERPMAGAKAMEKRIDHGDDVIAGSRKNVDVRRCSK